VNLGDPAAPRAPRAWTPATATASASPPRTPAPRTQLPVFVLDKGGLTAFDGPAGTGAMGINDRGEVVGLSINPGAMPGVPMGRMA
jgi:hypothetical protein